MNRSSPGLSRTDVSARELLLYRPPLGRDVTLYALAATLVFVSTIALVTQVRLQPAAPLEVAEIDHAVMIDLPPSVAAPAGKPEANEGPEQAASEAAPVSAAPTPEPPKPIDEPKPSQKARQAEPPPPAAPQAEATMPKAEDKAVNAPQATQPSPQIAEQAPRGVEAPKTSDVQATDEDNAPRASAQALSLWQRSMISRLETAKKGLPRHAGRTGTVRIAFALDRGGKLVDEKIDKSSGDTTLDDMARRLVRDAAPYPTPPTGTRDKDLLFTVPIRFKQ